MKLSKVQSTHESAGNLGQPHSNKACSRMPKASMAVPKTRGASGYVTGIGNVVHNTTKSTAGNSKDG